MFSPPSPQKNFVKPRHLTPRKNNKIFVKSRQPTVRKTRQVKADFGKIFSLNQGFLSFCKKIQIKSYRTRKKFKSNQESLRHEKKINLITYIVPVQRISIPEKKIVALFLKGK